MPELQEIKRTLSRIDKLEREVSLKQLQINSLLAITQAINENVSAEDLFKMYNSFLRWEIGIRKMALFFREGEKWVCKSSLGVAEDMLTEDISAELSKYRSKQGLESSNHALIREFDLVVPVLHKDVAIAYAFIGGFGDEDDVYNKVQFVTTITNVVAVAIENKRLFKQQLRQEIINREVEVAAEIQRTLVPSRLPSGENYQLSSIYKPHFAVGGDYYDVVEFKDGQIAFCIADITGKGVSAAMLMANFQANFHALVTRRPSLEEIVNELNAAVWRVTQGDKFITLFLAKYDVASRTLHYINAGHTPPLLLSNGEVIPLRNGCTSLGWLPELPFLEIGGLCLTQDALIFTYTDGLTDIRNDAGDYFSEEILTEFLQANSTLDAKSLNTKLLSHIEVFRGEQPFPDDITVLTCQIFGKEKIDARLSIALNENFDSFNVDRQDAFLKWMRETLHVNSIRLVRVDPGSVIITLELTALSAKKFMKLLYSDELKKYEIEDASLVFFDEVSNLPKIQKYNRGMGSKQTHFEFQEWKVYLKKRISNDLLHEVLLELQNMVTPDCQRFNNLITLSSQYFAIKKNLSTLRPENETLLLASKIVQGVLEEIDDLESHELLVD